MNLGKGARSAAGSTSELASTISEFEEVRLEDMSRSASGEEVGWSGNLEPWPWPVTSPAAANRAGTSIRKWIRPSWCYKWATRISSTVGHGLYVPASTAGEEESVASQAARPADEATTHKTPTKEADAKDKAAATPVRQDIALDNIAPAGEPEPEISWRGTRTGEDMPGLPTRGNTPCLSFRALAVAITVQRDWNNHTTLDMPLGQETACLLRAPSHLSRDCESVLLKLLTSQQALYLAGPEPNTVNADGEPIYDPLKDLEFATAKVGLTNPENRTYAPAQSVVKVLSRRMLLNHVLSCRWLRLLVRLQSKYPTR